MAEHRLDLIKSAFFSLAGSVDGHMKQREMLVVARSIGFDAAEELWWDEYGILCREHGVHADVGFNLLVFTDLVNDSTENGCYCTNEELTELLVTAPILTERPEPDVANHVLQPLPPPTANHVLSPLSPVSTSTVCNDERPPPPPDLPPLECEAGLNDATGAPASLLFSGSGGSFFSTGVEEESMCSGDDLPPGLSPPPPPLPAPGLVAGSSATVTPSAATPPWRKRETQGSTATPGDEEDHPSDQVKETAVPALEVVCKLFSGLWTGSEGEAYSLKSITAASWTCERIAIDKSSAPVVFNRIMYSPKDSQISWGDSYFLDVRELVAFPGTINWYDIKNTNWERPRFVWARTEETPSIITPAISPPSVNPLEAEARNGTSTSTDFVPVAGKRGQSKKERGQGTQSSQAARKEVFPHHLEGTWTEAKAGQEISVVTDRGTSKASFHSTRNGKKWVVIIARQDSEGENILACGPFKLSKASWTHGEVRSVEWIGTSAGHGRSSPQQRTWARTD